MLVIINLIVETSRHGDPSPGHTQFADIGSIRGCIDFLTVRLKAIKRTCIIKDNLLGSLTVKRYDSAVIYLRVNDGQAVLFIMTCITSVIA